MAPAIILKSHDKPTNQQLDASKFTLDLVYLIHPSSHSILYFNPPKFTLYLVF